MTSPSRPSPTASSRCCCAARRAARRTPATCSTSTAACSSAPASSPTKRARARSRLCPIIETQGGDVSAFVPTNVISITDGQCYLVSVVFNSGVRRAINVGLSVSRVGGSAQIPAMKEVRRSPCASTWRSYRELEAFAQFASDLDEVDPSDLLERGSAWSNCSSSRSTPRSTSALQVASIFAGTKGYLDEYAVARLASSSRGTLAWLRDNRGSSARQHPHRGQEEARDEVDSKLCTTPSRHSRRSSRR